MKRAVSGTLKTRLNRFVPIMRRSDTFLVKGPSMAMIKVLWATRTSFATSLCCVKTRRKARVRLTITLTIAIQRGILTFCC